VLKLVAGLFIHSYDSSWNSDHSRIIGNWLHNYRARADFYVISNNNISEDLGSGPNNDMVSYRGMALSLFLTGTTESYVLIDQDAVPDLGCLSDNNTHSVVNEKPATDPRSGMDLDSSEETADLGDDARQKWDSSPIQPVRKTVRENCVKSGIAKYDLKHTFSRRIFVKYRIDLFPNDAEHGCTIMAQGWCGYFAGAVCCKMACVIYLIKSAAGSFSRFNRYIPVCVPLPDGPLGRL
jgi:hypothetical protein